MRKSLFNECMQYPYLEHDDALDEGFWTLYPKRSFLSKLWDKIKRAIKKFWVTRILRRPWKTRSHWVGGYGKYPEESSAEVIIFDYNPRGL